VEKDRSPQKACRNCGGSRDCPRSGICKACYNAGRKRRYAEDFRYRAKILKKRAEYVDRNRETINAKAKERYQDPEARLVILARHKRRLKEGDTRVRYLANRRKKYHGDPTFKALTLEKAREWRRRVGYHVRRRERLKKDAEYRKRVNQWQREYWRKPENMERKRAVDARRLSDPRRRPETLRKLSERALKRQFGLTLKDYEKMAASCGNVCAICGLAPRGGRRLAVDHDHKTGAIRGLLCGGCNYGLGCFKDDPDRLVRAAEYIRAAGAKNP